MNCVLVSIFRKKDINKSMRLKKGACSSIGILLLLVFLFVYFQNNSEVLEATVRIIGKYFIIFTWKQFMFQTITKHSSRDSKSFSLLNCNCSRTLFNVETDNSVQFSQTTCGGDAFQRGSNQKVVGFSFYGDSSSELHQFRKYFDGIEENLRLVRSHYGPDWSMRLYYDLDKVKYFHILRYFHILKYFPNLKYFHNLK